MSVHRAVLLALLVVGGSLAVAAPTSAMADGNADSVDAVASGESRLTTAQDDAMQNDANETQTETSETGDDANDSLGADISSFMQSSSAEIGGAVETGMWTASFNATTNRSTQRQLVERRTNQLRDDLTDLQNRKEELAAEREAGNITKPAYKAKVGQLVGQINALQAAINATESRARQSGANVEAIRMLESDTQNLSGPEIAAVARNTTGIGNGVPGNAGNGNGPPNGVGNGTVDVNDTDGTSNSNGIGVGNGNGSNGIGGADDNASGERGPPDDLPVDANDSENLTDDSDALTTTLPTMNDSDETDESDVGINTTTVLSFESSASDDA